MDQWTGESSSDSVIRVLASRNLRTEMLSVVLDLNQWGPEGYSRLERLSPFGIKPIGYGYMAGAAADLGGLDKEHVEAQIDQALMGTFDIAGKDSLFDDSYRNYVVGDWFPSAKITEGDEKLLDARKKGDLAIRTLPDEFTDVVGRRVANSAKQNPDVLMELMKFQEQTGGTLRAIGKSTKGSKDPEEIALTSIHDAANIMHVGVVAGAEAPLIPDESHRRLFTLAHAQMQESKLETLEFNSANSMFHDLAIGDQWDLLIYAIDEFEKCWFHGVQFDPLLFRAKRLDLIVLNLMLSQLRRIPENATHEDIERWREQYHEAAMAQVKNGKKLQSYADLLTKLSSSRGVKDALTVAGVLPFLVNVFTAGALKDVPLKAMQVTGAGGMQVALGHTIEHGVNVAANSVLGVVAATDLNMYLAARYTSWLPDAITAWSAGDKLN